MKRFLFIVFVLFSYNTFATEIAVINVENITKNSVAFKKLSESLEKEKTSYQEKIKQKEIELSAKKDDLESKSSILSKEVLQKRALEFQKEVLAFQEEVRSVENDLNTKLNQGLMKLNSEIGSILKEMLKEEKYKKYSAVASSAVFLYYKEENDITLETLKLLNKKNISLLEKKK
jgi:Skp family chaperone for outer membrane proteins